MSAVRALFAGPGAFRALRPGRGGAIELAFGRCAYARLESDWILVAEPSLPFGPLSVAVAGLSRLDVFPGLPVRVADTSLVVGEGRVGLERMRARSGPSAGLGTRSAVREACAAVALPGPPEVLRDGIAALTAGRVLAAVGMLAGVGEGLTPAGDDVLCGYSAARAALGAPVTLSTLATARSSPLGLAYLRCAERGELPDVAARVLAAIGRGSPSEVAATVPALSAWGATSGIALGWGLVAGVTVAGSRPPAAASMGPPGPVRSVLAGPRRVPRARDGSRRPATGPPGPRRGPPAPASPSFGTLVAPPPVNGDSLGYSASFGTLAPSGATSATFLALARRP